MTRQPPLCHIMRSTHAAPGDTNEGATAPLALSSKSVSASHVLFIRLIMAALRSHLKRAAAVLGTAHCSACSDQLPGKMDEAGKRWGEGCYAHTMQTICGSIYPTSSFMEEEDSACFSLTALVRWSQALKTHSNWANRLKLCVKWFPGKLRKQGLDRPGET